MHRTYVRYQSQFKGEEASQFLSNIIAIVAAVAGLSGIGFTLFAGRIAELLDVPVADEIFILGVVIAGSMTYTLGLSIASSAKRISVPFFMKNVGIRLILLISAYLVSKDHLDFSFWMKILPLSTCSLAWVCCFTVCYLRGFRFVNPKPLNKGLSQELATFAGSGVIMAVMTM